MRRRILSYVFLEKTYSGKKAGKTPLGARVAFELQGGITWYSIKETSPWREQGSPRGELVFAWRDAGEYLRWRGGHVSLPRHWELVARCCETRASFARTKRSSRRLHVNIGACCRAKWWMRNVRYDVRICEQGNGWKRGYLVVSWMLGIAWPEEGLVSFQFSFDSLTEYRF